MSEVKQRNPTEFNYAQLETSIAEFLRKKENNIYEIIGKAETEVGKELYEAQQELSKNGYGCYGEWCESVFGFNRMKASRLVNRYKLIVTNCDKQDLLEELPKSLTYEISKPSSESTEPKRQAKRAVLDGDIKTSKEYHELVAKLEKAEQRAETLEREKELAEQRERIAQRDAELAKKALEDTENETLTNKSYTEEPYGVGLGMTVYEAMDKLSEWQKEYSWIVTDTTEFKKLIEDDPNFARTFNRLDKFWQQISEVFHSVRNKGTYDDKPVNNTEIIDADFTEIL